MADTYKPTSGMASAARRALKWKEDGKATGAGTAVGWTRARQLANGESLTLDTVKRMYSFFSRHEVDKKGKGFYDGPEFPSNGRIMWDAWGGDAGFSWSRAIVNRAKKKSESKADSVKVGSMVSWNSSGGKAEGKVVRIVRNGSIDVPNSDFTITGTPEDPAALIRLYRDGKPTDTYVGHKLSTLKASVSKSDENDEDEYPEDEYANIPESELEVDYMEKRDYNAAQRKRMAQNGQAMDDGSFPIADEADLRNAIQSVGRASDYEAAKRHIMRRAKALRREDLLPEDWKKSVKKSWNGFFGG